MQQQCVKATAYKARKRYPRVGSREALVRRAEGLVPILRQRAPHTDEIRRLPDDTRHDLRTSGVAVHGGPVPSWVGATSQSPV